MTDSKSDPENLDVQRSEFSVQRSGAAGRAIFLSYASQDAATARRIAESLRANGVDVWFDQGEDAEAVPAYFTFGQTVC